MEWARSIYRAVWVDGGRLLSDGIFQSKNLFYNAHSLNQTYIDEKVDALLPYLLFSSFFRVKPN